MEFRRIILSIVILTSIVTFLPSIYGEPSISIKMEKTTYSYCEKLFYTINVSEVTGDFAIIHIIDESEKRSSAIPIPITSLENPVPAPSPFEKEVFPTGKYVIEVQYSGAQTSAEFNVVDSDKICIPELIKPILVNWISGNISDGFLIDAFQKYIDKELIEIPFEITKDNVYNVNIPEWMKNVGYWWIEGKITDSSFVNVINYLIDKKMISMAGEGNEV